MKNEKLFKKVIIEITRSAKEHTLANVNQIDNLPIYPISSYLRLLNINIVQSGMMCNIPANEIKEAKQKANKAYIRFRRSLL